MSRFFPLSWPRGKGMAAVEMGGTDPAEAIAASREQESLVPSSL